jgi:hypothetical protein
MRFAMRFLGAGIIVTSFAGVAFADAAYTVKVDAPAAKRAEKAKAHVHIAPSSGYHMNKDYPTSVTVVAPAGVTVEKAKLTTKDGGITLAEAGADFDVVFTATEAGKKSFDGEIRFAVCTANSCDPKKEKLSFTVEVK